MIYHFKHLITLVIKQMHKFLSKSRNMHILFVHPNWSSYENIDS